MTSDDRAVVARLWQLYSHDMADVRGICPNRQGLYRLGRLPSYYDNPDCAGSVIDPTRGRRSASRSSMG